jgi:hypothetical protein
MMIASSLPCELLADAFPFIATLTIFPPEKSGLPIRRHALGRILCAPLATEQEPVRT